MRATRAQNRIAYFAIIILCVQGLKGRPNISKISKLRGPPKYRKKSRNNPVQGKTQHRRSRNVKCEMCVWSHVGASACAMVLARAYGVQRFVSVSSERVCCKTLSMHTVLHTHAAQRLEPPWPCGSARAWACATSCVGNEFAGCALESKHTRFSHEHDSTPNLAFESVSWCVSARPSDETIRENMIFNYRCCHSSGKCEVKLYEQPASPPKPWSS